MVFISADGAVNLITKTSTPAQMGVLSCYKTCYNIPVKAFQFLVVTFIVFPFILVCILMGIVGKEHEDTLKKIRAKK